MAVYKVPQDVEADDKLIGPFSFRQFIYLIIVVISCALAYGLSTIFLALAILPLPIILFFAALALPLRKDQPMEAYLSAVVSFYFLKSRKRFWQPDGIDSFVTIIPPKDSERILTKNLTGDEATQRLSYLSDLVDTHGWAIRGAGALPDTSINTDLYYESQQVPDMMDNTTPAAQALSQQLSDDADQQRQDAISTMRSATAQPLTYAEPAQATPATAPSTPGVAVTPIDDTVISTLPSVAVIKERQEQAARQAAEKETRDAIALANALAEEATSAKPATPAPKPAPTTSVSTPDTGTMELTKQQADDLSQQADVSVQTLAHEANRVAQKNKVLKSGDEVTISFR